MPSELRRLLGPLLLLLLAAACQSARRSGDDSDRDPYLIKAEELEASNRANLYDAILELRPRWLKRAGRPNVGDPYVYLDDQVLGTAGALRRFLPSEIAEVRYLSPTEAQVQYGQKNYGRPAIVLILFRD